MTTSTNFTALSHAFDYLADTATLSVYPQHYSVTVSAKVVHVHDESRIAMKVTVIELADELLESLDILTYDVAATIDFLYVSASKDFTIHTARRLVFAARDAAELLSSLAKDPA